jgi:hypothetical protein
MPAAKSKRKKCDYCGLGGLHWAKEGQRWRLFSESGELHDCMTGILSPKKNRDAYITPTNEIPMLLVTADENNEAFYQDYEQWAAENEQEKSEHSAH